MGCRLWAGHALSTIEMTPSPPVGYLTTAKLGGSRGGIWRADTNDSPEGVESEDNRVARTPEEQVG